MTSTLEALAGKVFIWQRFNQVIYLLRNIVLAWYILPSETGIFSTALTLTSLTSILSTLEFRTAFFSKKDLSKLEINTQWSAEVLGAIATLFIGLLITPWIQHGYGMKEWIAMVALLIVNLLNARCSTHLYLLEKELKFAFLSALRAGVNLTAFLITLSLAIQGWGWKALVLDQILIALMMSIFLIRKSRWKTSFCWDKSSLQWYWGFVSILFLTGLLGKVVFGFDIFALSTQLGKTAREEIGIYSMAMKWALVPMDLGAGALAVLALSFYSHRKIQGMDAIRKGYAEITFHISRFCLTITVCMGILMQDFFHFLYPNTWEKVPWVFSALIPYALFRPLFQNASQALQAIQKLWIIFTIMLTQSLLGIGLIWYAVPHGLQAVALASGATLGSGYLAMEFILHRNLRYPLWFIFGNPILLSIIAVGIFWNLPKGNSMEAVLLRFTLVTCYALVSAFEWTRHRGQLEKEINP